MNRRAAYAWRAAWAVMLALHAPALAAAWVSVFAQPSGVVRCLSLSISAAFFILKIADVSWLRMRHDRRAIIAMVTALALIHAGVPAHWGAADAPAPPMAALAAGTTLVLMAAAAVRARAPSHRVRRRDASRDHTLVAASIRRTSFNPPPPNDPVQVRAVLPNRAPPLSC